MSLENISGPLSGMWVVSALCLCPLAVWGEENESGVVLTEPSMRWLLQMCLCSSLTSCLQSSVLGLLLLRQESGQTAVHLYTTGQNNCHCLCTVPFP